MLDEAISYVHGHSNAKFEASKPVLLNRLELRKTLLAAVTLDGIVDPQKAVLWEQCLKLIPLLLQSKDFGVPVPESFNIKIQRKLASTVPPRPMVETKLVDAIRFFELLCQSGRDAYKILNYRGGSNLQVGKPYSTYGEAAADCFCRHLCGGSTLETRNPLSTVVLCYNR